MLRQFKTILKNGISFEESGEVSRSQRGSAATQRNSAGGGKRTSRGSTWVAECAGPASVYTQYTTDNREMFRHGTTGGGRIVNASRIPPDPPDRSDRP